MEMWDEMQNSQNHILEAHAQFQEDYASLGGKWRFQPLKQDEEIPDGWLDAVYDDRKWDRMVIPCTDTAETGIADQNIVVSLYRKSFTLSRQPGSKRIIFRFQHCQAYAKLWINGQEIGSTANITGAAEFDITSAIRPEKNQICIEVRRCAGLLPLIREDLGLYTLPDRCITDIQVRSLPKETGRLQIRVNTRNADGFTARIALMDENRILSHREAAVEDNSATALFSCPELKMWCPEKPALYRIAVILWDGIANYHTRELTFGLRTAEVQDHVLLVNGQPEKVYAMDFSIRDPETGLLLGNEKLETQLRGIREHNFNGIRVSEPVTEVLLQLCDRIGLYVLEQTHAIGNAERLYAARANHPCVLSWDLETIEQSIVQVAEDMVVACKDFTTGVEQLRSFDKHAVAIFGSYAHCVAQYRQAKAALAPVACSYEGTVLTIVNHSRFCSTGELDGRTVLTRDGEVILSKALSVDVPPMAQASVALETRYDIYKPGRYHLSAEFSRKDSGNLVARDQWDVGVLRHIYDENPGGTIREEAGCLVLRAQEASYSINRITACPEQISVDGIDCLTAPLLPVFATVNPGLHIPDEWERFTARWKKPKPAVMEVDQMTRTVSASFRLGSGLIQTYRLFADGSLSVDLRLRTGKTGPERIGLQGIVHSELTQCSWFGLGPEFSDCDNRLGRYFGIHRAPAFDGQFRDQVYDLTLTNDSGIGLRIRSESALRFALKPATNGTMFTLELAQNEAFLPHTTYSLSFTVCPVK